MINIKTWKQLLNERIGDMQITTNDDVRLAMQDHIDALTEALKVAQEETHSAIQHKFVLIKQRGDFRAERDALQAKLEEVAQDRDEWKEATILANQRFKTAEAKLSAIEAQAPVEYQAFSGRWRAVDESTFNNYAEQDRRALYAAPVAPAQPSTPLTPKGMTDAVMDLVDVLARDPESTKLIDPQAWAHLSVYMPAQPVNELVEALEDARDVLYQVAHGNTACGKDAEDVGGLIAIALANAKAAQPLTKEQVQPSNICKKHSCLWAGDGCPHCKDEQVQPAQWTAGAKMPCGAVVTNVYDAYEAGKKAAQPLTKEKVEDVIDILENNACGFDDHDYKEIKRAIEIMKGVKL